MSKKPKSVRFQDLSKEEQKKITDEAYEKLAHKVGTTTEQVDKISAKQKHVLELEENERRKKDEIEAEKLAKKRIDDALVELVFPFELKINGKRYGPGKVIVKASVGEMLAGMSGGKHMRLIREKVSTKNEVFILSTGQVSSRQLSAEDSAGVKVGKV